MGQHTSKHHDPLTFGYVKQTNSSNSSLPPDPDPGLFNDHILVNPHLYQFQITCQNDCAGYRRNAVGRSRGDSLSESKEDNSVFVAAELKQECEVCRRNKRLSLVRRDLAEDLAYIDETYYPDIPAPIHHLIHSNDDDNNNNSSSNDQWTTLTMDEVMTGTNGAGRRRAHASPLVVNLSGRSLIKMSPSIGYLDTIAKLDLSHNQITTLPETIGYMKNLEVLDASHNELESLPDTIGYLSKLTELHVGFNRLRTLPTSIGVLPKLKTIVVNDNQLSSIPVEIAKLSELVHLDVSNNPLPALPVEIAILSSLKLVTEGCEFVSEFRYPLEHGPPSLVEICSRIAVRKEMQIPSHLSDHIKEYLSRAQTCSFCGGPFFESYVKRGRFTERSVGLTIALEYRLCSSHWTDDADRTVALFAPVPDTAPRPLNIIHHDVDMAGLEQLYAPQPQRRILGRYRGYSDLSVRSHIESPQHHLYSSSSYQQRSSSTSLVPRRVGSPDTISIRSLRSQPNLPALPDLQASETGTTSPPFSNRARSASAASVTKRLAAILSPPPPPLTQSLRGSSLQQHWSPNDTGLLEEQDTTSTSESHESTMQAGPSKIPGPRLIRSGLSSLGVRLTSRDRSETL